jgi:hypothetical protein
LVAAYLDLKASHNMGTAAVCSLENYLVLPDHTMDERIRAAREILGREVVIHVPRGPDHHSPRPQRWVLDGRHG